MKNNEYIHLGRNQEGFIPYKEMVTQSPGCILAHAVEEVAK